MCTKLYTVINPMETIRFGSKVSFDVPCLHCKECVDAKIKGYLLRNYLEFRFCHDKGGYVYFDTLTYNNDCIPQTDGQYHFNSVHVKNFLKRLRIKIFRKYGIKRDAFKFWLVSEYGGDRFRPHYHVLFYVYANIPLFEFKRLISASWWYGFTDSYYMTKKHVLKNCAAIRYLVKYLAKFDDFDLFQRGYVKLHPDSPIAKWTKEQFRMCRPFMRMSVNLGYSDNIDLLACNTVKIPTKEGEPDLFAYTGYYRRKQLYEKVVIELEDGSKVYQKTPNGSYVYRLNDKGRMFKMMHYDEDIQIRTDRFRKIYNSMPFGDRCTVDFLLDHRTLKDLAVFDLVFAFRLFDLSYLHLLRNWYNEDWDSFSRCVYSDTLQINMRCLDSDFYVQSYRDTEFFETRNFYTILEMFRCVKFCLNELKDKDDTDLLSITKRLDKVYKTCPDAGNFYKSSKIFNQNEKLVSDFHGRFDPSRATSGGSIV